MDCDQHSADAQCGIAKEALLGVLQQSLDQETELLRTYTITAERIHDNETLKDRLRNFAEGNAKRTRQLMDEISALH